MMREREKIFSSGLLLLLFVSWFGFLFHRSGSFAGTLAGGALGVVGALLLLVPLIYLFIKRVPFLKRVVTRRVSMSTLLTWHIYAGIVGPILGLLHTGHKFDSLLGLSLTAFMLVAVFSGFLGRYFFSFINEEIADKKILLHGLEQEYHVAAIELKDKPELASALLGFSGMFSRLVGSVLFRSSSAKPSLPQRVISLAESIADVEFAIRTHTGFKRAFSIWLKLHIAISLVLYGLLTAHVVGGIYYGLRWFE